MSPSPIPSADKHIGDPAHIQDHNQITARCKELLTAMGSPADAPPLPGDHSLGQTGHTDDHNKIVAFLRWLEDNPISGGWADFDVPGVTPKEYVSDGSDGVKGATYKLWRIRTNVVARCIKPGVAEMILSGAGGGGCGGAPEYPLGGGGSGGVYVDGGEKFITDNDSGLYHITIGAGGGGAGQKGGDTTIKNGDGSTTLVTKRITCGGGSTNYGTDYGGCRNQSPGASGWIGDVEQKYPSPMSGGSGGQNANPGAPSCAGESRQRWILGGTEWVSGIGGSGQGAGTNGGTGTCAGQSGGVILRVLVKMP